MSNTIKLAVFDLDGTLNQTHLYSLPAVRKALGEFGVSGYSDAHLMDCIGNRSEDYMPTLLPDHGREDWARYLERELYWEEHFIKMACGSYPGIPESLHQLREAGVETAVCSNAPMAYIEMVLTSIGIDGLIDHRQFLVPGLDKRQTLGLLLEKVGTKTAVMVGDRVFDKEAARANRLPFLGCAYGYGPTELSGADALAQSGWEVAEKALELIGLI